MMPVKTNDWNEANQRYLVASVRWVREELEAYRNQIKDPGTQASAQQEKKATAAYYEMQQVAAVMPSPPALETLATIFGLSVFERKIILLCAGVELDASFSKLVSLLEGDEHRLLPSFSLALSAFEEAHWSALSPGAPLRYWKLIECNTSSLLTRSPIKIDEQILNYLTGVQHLEERLMGVVVPVFTSGDCVSSHEEIKNQMIQVCMQHRDTGKFPVIVLGGNNFNDKVNIAKSACSKLGINLYSIQAHVIPAAAREMSEFSRLWNRESTLNNCALFLDCSEMDYTDKAQIRAVASFIENVQGLLIADTGYGSIKIRKQKVVFIVQKPNKAEQLFLWQSAWGNNNGSVQLKKLVSQFDLSAATISTTGTEAGMQLSTLPADQQENYKKQEKILWEACSSHTRQQIQELAQRIEPAANWDDIILPEAQKETLREIVTQVKHRNRVYNDWGFDSKGSRGFGISALFTGESGTGKTMASEILANELHLDLYRIDLSQVVNKYIGETEKNLKRIFDAAEEGGVILLFDEADALFGKRSDVKDSHDRYSNIEVSYLLQRMESYRGLAILTTNMKSTLDSAFLRRIRFVVQFPFPDIAQRAEIWKHIFPGNTPVDGLDMAKLARLNMPGGNIRNIAMNAAFIAADEGLPVQMTHVMRAAKSEYQKLEKNLSHAELPLK